MFQKCFKSVSKLFVCIEVILKILGFLGLLAFFRGFFGGPPPKMKLKHILNANYRTESLKIITHIIKQVFQTLVRNKNLFFMLG